MRTASGAQTSTTTATGRETEPWIRIIHHLLRDWLHVWVGERSTVYAIDPHRRADALEAVIGRDWSGVLCHDGYATYDRFASAVHQSCVAHALRRAREIFDGAVRGAVRCPRQVIALFTEAVHLRNEHLRGTIPLEALRDRRDAFDDRLLTLLRRPRRVESHARLTRQPRPLAAA